MGSHHKIALLGGSGFIGTRLASDLLWAGHDVLIGDIAESASYPDLRVMADVRDLDSLLASCSDCDTIINLAAAHRDDVRPISLYYDTNVTGARMVCAAAEKLGINRIVFTSSVAVYGHQAGTPDEDSPHHPINPYGETKSQAEAVFLEWFRKSPETRTLVMIRPSVVFGPSNRGNVHTLMDQVVRGRFLMVGNGENKKSMAYVGNLCGFIRHTLSFGAGLHVFNYADKPDFSMNDLVRLICRLTGRQDVTRRRIPFWLGMCLGGVFDVVAHLTGRRFPISRIRVEKFCASTVFSANRALSSGYVPSVSLEQALTDTIAAEFASAREEV